jgi:putative sterol carrier protein
MSVVNASDGGSSVDVRTRVDGPVAVVDARRFFGQELPAALSAATPLPAPAIRALKPAPLAIESGGAAWTLIAEGDRITVAAGAIGGAARLSLDPQQLADLVHDQVAPMGWFASGKLKLHGSIDHLLDWWMLLRGALDGVQPYLPGSITFKGRDGSPLDFGRAFRFDDRDEELRDFLIEAGYLHVEGVFSEAEMAAISVDMDRAAPSYSRGDGRSWWARTADGADHLVRMQRFDERSAAAEALLGDGRLARFSRLTGDGHALGNKLEGNRIEALVKPLGIVQGISDVPWHKDCALGRHSYDCCSITVGISVTGADERSGQLKVVAGSHRALMWPAMLQPGLDLPVIDLPTRTGDITVHLSCTLHMAQPPVDRERRVLYTGFGLPPRDLAATKAAKRRLLAVREAAPVTVSQPSAADVPSRA